MPKKSDKIILEKVEVSNPEQQIPSESSSSPEQEKETISKNQRKPYVMTEARKEAFEKAKLKRAENLKIKQELKAKELEHLNKLKEMAKSKKIKKIEKLESEIKNISDSDDTKEEIIIAKKKRAKKPRKQVVYVSDSDENEGDKKNVIIINNGSKDLSQTQKEDKKMPRVNYGSYFV
jgi:hypothetical protein